MKRILLSLTAIFVVMTIAAKTQLPRTVQGVPYTPKAADGKLRAASDWEWATPDDMAGDANFTFDMIKNWRGRKQSRSGDSMELRRRAGGFGVWLSLDRSSYWCRHA